MLTLVVNSKGWKMNRAINLVGFFTVVMFMASCSVLEPAYKFEKIYPSTPQVYIKDLKMIEKDGKSVVTGKLKKRFSSIVITKGHVDIAVYSSEGLLLLETTTAYTSSLNLRSIQRRGGNRFSATLDIIPPSGSVIKVAFHREGFKKSPDPEHELNIAR